MTSALLLLTTLPLRSPAGPRTGIHRHSNEARHCQVPYSIHLISGSSAVSCPYFKHLTRQVVDGFNRLLMDQTCRGCCRWWISSLVGRGLCATRLQRHDIAAPCPPQSAAGGPITFVQSCSGFVQFCSAFAFVLAARASAHIWWVCQVRNLWCQHMLRRRSHGGACGGLCELSLPTSENR